MRGTYRADRHGQRGAEPDPTPLRKLPKPPSWLGPHGVTEWKRAGRELLADGLLTVVDLPSFEAYCASYQRAVEAERQLATGGLTMRTSQGEGPRAEVGIAKAAWGEVRRFAAEFGLSPTARTRLGIAAKGKPQDEPANPWEEFVKRRQPAPHQPPPPPAPPPPKSA